MVGKGEERKVEEINGGKKRGEREEEESREEIHSRNVQKVNSMLSKTRFALTRKVTKFSPDSSELLFSSSTNKGTKWSVKAPIRWSCLHASKHAIFFSTFTGPSTEICWIGELLGRWRVHVSKWESISNLGEGLKYLKHEESD